MSRNARFSIAILFGRILGARLLNAPIVALSVALSTSAACADSEYPPGLFENSPVVGPGSSGAAASSGSAAAAPSEPPGPGASAETPGYAAPSGPYDDVPLSAPPRYVAPGPPQAYAPPPYDYCAGIASRAFGSLAEVRRAHARCDHAGYAPPPPGYPPPN